MFGDEYVVVGCRDGKNSLVHIIDGATMKEVAQYKPTDAVVDTGYSGVGIMNNKIYACDHSKTDTIYVSNTLKIPAKPVAKAPATFDPTAIAAIAAIVSAAGFAISKKRK